MSAPAVSAVMAVHNGMPHVEASVRSVLAQSFHDFEFVIGDDGSSDGSSDVLRALAAQDRRIRLLRRETKSGLAASANWVVGEARAPLVAIVHADDIAYPERLARQHALFQAQPGTSLVATLSDGIDEEGRTVRPADWWRLLSGAPLAPFVHSSIMFRRASFDRVGGYRAAAEYWEDLDLYLRLAETGRLLVVPEVLTGVRHTGISTRLRERQEEVEDAVDLMYRAIDAYARGEDYDAVLRAGRAGGRLHPKTFVARGSTRLWSGRRPGQMRRLLKRGDLRPDAASLQALGWVGWGAVSPRSLRFVVRAILRARNALARRSLGACAFVEWHPRGGARPGSAAGRL
ncbi:MAG: glycosyltransferase family A protein, partial [Allosphingosinicella sp.]